MATFTNSERFITTTHTNEFLEAILLQLNASSTYYTTGENRISIKIGSSKVLL